MVAGAARRRSWPLVLLALIAALGVAGCSGTDPQTGGAISTACQDARTAFNAWLKADREAFQSTSSLISHAMELNGKVGAQASRATIKALIGEVNAGVKVATQKTDKSGQLYDAFVRPFKECMATKNVKLPPACANELKQYPAVTAAITKNTQAQAAVLTKTLALRTALVARDQRGVNAANDQITAATNKLNAVIDSWNKTIQPRYDTAVQACNKAIA